MAAVNVIALSEAVKNNRFSAEFFDPRFVFTPKDDANWVPIGRALRKCEYGLSVAMNTEQRGFPMFRMNEISNCFAERPEKYANIPRTLFEAYALNKDDVLFNRTNSFEFVGRTGIVTDQLDCTFASYLIRLVPNREKLLPEFLTVYLNTTFGIGQVKRRAMRSINQANVSGSEIRRVSIVLPDIEEQRSVAALVTAANKELQTSNERYAEAKLTLDVEIGLDRLSFKKPLGHATTFSATMQAGRFDADYFQPKYESIRSLIATYPGGYEPLLGCCDALRPNVDPSRTPNASFEYIELSNIDTSVGLVEGALSGTGAMLPTRARRQVKAGDVIASSVVGSIDKAAAILDGQDGHIASTGFFHLRPKMVSTEYLLLLVRSPCVRMQFQQQSTGGILSAVPDRRLKYVIVPRIPTSLQREITDLVASAHAAKRKSRELLEQAKHRVEEMIERAVHQ